MDVAWQDGVGSFLNSSGIDPRSFVSFAGDDGALWSSSADNPVFSGQSMLWESGADAPADSHISGLTADSDSGTDTSGLFLGGWIADGTPAVAGGTLQGGLLWAGGGSDTSSALTNGSGTGLGSLGALDLTAGSSASLWQQFIDGFGTQVATWAADVPHLLWTGAGSQPLTAVVAEGSQPILIAPTDSLPLPTLASLSPAQLTWTQPSGAPGLTIGPSLTDAASTPAISGTGAAVPQNVAALSPAGELPTSGVSFLGPTVNPMLTRS